MVKCKAYPQWSCAFVAAVTEDVDGIHLWSAEAIAHGHQIGEIFLSVMPLAYRARDSACAICRLAYCDASRNFPCTAACFSAGAGRREGRLVTTTWPRTLRTVTVSLSIPLRLEPFCLLLSYGAPVSELWRDAYSVCRCESNK